MTVEEIIAAASEQTGLSDIGDRAVLEGLERLLKSYAEEARFNERGAQMAYGDLVTYMAIRMKIEGWLGEHPELLDAPIEKPLFVFGLPRTGTTHAGRTGTRASGTAASLKARPARTCRR